MLWLINLIEQLKRTRETAEVFTLSWLCNEMINHCDEMFFNRKNVFNILNGQTWQPVSEPYALLNIFNRFSLTFA